MLIVDEVGDLSASHDTKDWAIAVRNHLNNLLYHSAKKQDSADIFLDSFEKAEGYKQLAKKDGSPFESITEFYEYPKPFGLGNPPRIKERIKVLRKHGANQHSLDSLDAKGGCANQHTLETRGQGQKSYILARLARDHPDILAAFDRGEYRSARQAGIAAGFIKDVKRIQVAPIPEKIANKLIEVLELDQIKEVVRLLKEVMPTP